MSAACGPCCAASKHYKAPSDEGAAPLPAPVPPSKRSARLAGVPSAPSEHEWTPPNDPDARTLGFAGGCANSAYTPLARCWPCFEHLPQPGVDGWLHKDGPGVKDRGGQTVHSFARPISCCEESAVNLLRSQGVAIGPSRSASVVYLCPMGNVDGAPRFADLAEVLQATFSLPVRPLPEGLTKAEMARVERKPRGCGYGPQMETPSARALLMSRKPDDAFCIVGYTTEDLCHTAKEMRFLFGQASPSQGCGIFSFARYLGARTSETTVFRRCAMVLVHEVGHLWRIKHCVFAKCMLPRSGLDPSPAHGQKLSISQPASLSGLMNGSNHLEESEDRPFAICPIDVKKWHLALTAAKLGPDVCTDLFSREETLHTIFTKHGLRADAARCRQRLAALRGEAIPHEPVLARQSDLMGRTRPELQKLAKQYGVHAGSTREQLARELADLSGFEFNEEGENVPPNGRSEGQAA